MDFNKNLFSILAILAVICVIFSAAAVSANQESDFYLDGYEDGHNGEIIPPDNTHDEQAHAAGSDYYLNGNEDGHNGTIVPPDANHNEEKVMNGTGNAAGENIQNTTDATNTTNPTDSENATATHTMPATGNPILALLAVSAVLGGVGLIRRK